MDKDHTQLRLKRVKIHGFKTFADKTEFDLDGDLIAVVGPNGCGKSNLVDAILWGLGEPNARALRAANAQEIIFSGSAKRKPLGYAEVSLHFDNEDGALLLDAPEVVITRRVHRNGDSEFEINRQRCRLKDIYDVLADSGLGRSGYSIVGQKEIDAALAASAEERRAWIDEAAGVQRYRAKRHESIRRLATAGEHLARVEDILRELDAQREPLRAEAEVAGRYKTILGELREVESALLVKEVADSVAALHELQQQAEHSETQVSECRKHADELEAKAKAASEEISDVERTMDGLREVQQASLSARDRAEANRELMRQRLVSLEELEKNLDEEHHHRGERLAAITADLEAAREEEANARARFEALEAELSGAGEESARLRAELDRCSLELENAKARHAQAVANAAEAKMRAERRRAVRKEVEGIRATMPELDRGVAEAEEALAESEKKLNELREERNRREADATGFRSRVEQMAAATRGVQAEIAQTEARRQGIEATLATHEGLAQGSRAVLAAVEQGALPREYELLATSIHVEKDLALAIETSLGGSQHDLIVPNEQAAKAAIEFLKQHRQGRATFQPLTLVRPSARNSELTELLRQTGILGVAADLVSCAPQHRAVVESVLGRVVVAETLDTALHFAKTRGWSRMVTLDGEVVHSSGAVSGGTSARQTVGLVQRRADLDELDERRKGLEKKLAQLRAEQARLEREQAGSGEEFQALASAIREQETEVHDARRWFTGLRAERNQTERSLEKLEAELQELDQAVAADDEPVDVATIEATRDAAIQALAKQSANADLAMAALAEADQRVQMATLRREEAERRLARETATAEQRHGKTNSIEDERARSLAAMEKYEAERGDAQLRYDHACSELAAATAARRKLLEQSFALGEEAKQVRQDAATFEMAAHRAQVDRARTDAKRASAQERLLEEYGIDEENALLQSANVVVPENAAQSVGTLRRELKSMGDVNLGAIEAYERLSERFEELHHQHADILAGKSEIEAGIRELDRLTSDKFHTAFGKVREEFSVMLAKLFGGGEGELLLTDPANLLETGVDVEVTVPGKRKQRLELLSGGERALAACAFLFALLKVKPSPLVVLDEVDAPLDGRNVERYLEGIREFAGQTQFICITHNPLTIDAAPIWFGITMQDPGCSTVIPYRTPTAPAPEMTLA